MVSLDFINECKNDAYKNRLGKLCVGNAEFTGVDNLQNFTIDSGCYVDGTIIGTMCSKKLTSELVDALNNDFIDKELYASVGVKYASDLTEYINLGKYIIERPKDEITADFTSITAYDELINNLDKVYICGLDYENNDITVAELYMDLCNNLGLTPKTNVFTCSTIPIQSNPFTNGEKNREVLKAIESVSCTFAQIDSNTSEIDLCWLSATEEPDYTFELNDYTTLNGGKITYGPINSLVVKYSDIDDENITIVDSESIATNGENQLVISEDYILIDSSLRQLAINEIWNKVHNLKYVDCELTTYYGKPFLKIGDKIRIYTDVENYFDTYVLQHTFTFDGTFKSVIKSPVLTKQEVATKQEQTLGKRLRATEIKINKQDGQINAVVSDVAEQKSEIAQLEITSNSISMEVSKQTTAIDELGNTISSIQSVIQEQTDNAIITWFETSGIQGTLDNLQSAIDNNDEDIEIFKSYITQSVLEDGTPYLELGKSDNQTKIRILPERIQFLTNGKETAYISNNSLYINESTILTKQQIGHWVTVEDEVGNLNTYWVN